MKLLKLGSSPRMGFTLVELLIVITILVIILSMTVYGVVAVSEADRVSGAAAQVQSFLAGARDRAIYEKENRGVRLFVDPTYPRSVTAMAYVQPGEEWGHGLVDLERPDFDGDGNADNVNVTIVSGMNLGWWQLKRRGLISDGSLIEIPADSNSFYEVDTALIDITSPPPGTQDPPQPERLRLKIPYAEPGSVDGQAVRVHQAQTYNIILPSQLLAKEPSLLPESVVIDLDASSIPSSWRPDPIDSQGQFFPYMDIFFSPRGNVVGTAASAGLLHLYVCDRDDSQFLKETFLADIDPTLGPNTGSPLDTFEALISTNPFIPADELFTTWLPSSRYSATDPYIVKERKLVTIFAQTGAITSNPIDAQDLNSDGFADSPFQFAESGLGVK